MIRRDMILYDQLKQDLIPCDAIWSKLISFDIIWHHLTLSFTFHKLWFVMVSTDMIWCEFRCLIIVIDIRLDLDLGNINLEIKYQLMIQYHPIGTMWYDSMRSDLISWVAIWSSKMWYNQVICNDAMWADLSTWCDYDLIWSDLTAYVLISYVFFSYDSFATVLRWCDVIGFWSDARSLGDLFILFYILTYLMIYDVFSYDLI